MKLLGSPASPYTRKVRVVLAEKRIECEMELVDVQPVENPVNEHNPLGKIPTLLLDDGSALYDSRVIVDFLDARSPIGRLIPDETRDRVAVRRWEALADGVLDAGLLVRYESLRERRDLIVGVLNEVPGVKCLVPGGAFYAWPNVTEACRMIGAADSEEFRKRLLAEAGVAVLADIHFGSRVPGEGQHVRFSYAASKQAIEAGVQRMADFIRKNTRKAA